MECPNQTAPTEFILAGLHYPKELTVPLFLFFLIMYILTLFGNSLILWVVLSNTSLQKPMYWFLCHLSILDIAFSSLIVPKFLAGFIPSGKVISLGECKSQVFLINLIGCSECLLYALMAYDRFIAICKPLQYSNIMTGRCCFILSLGTVIGGCLHSMLETILTFRLPFGQRNLVEYIFCDIPALLKLACADTRLNEIVSLIDVGLVAMTCFLLILTSYVYIVTAILRIKSSEGRHRAFSTCTAHIIVVLIYYIPTLLHYLTPATEDSMNVVICISYTSVTPFLNPIIYTLRNKDIKLALAKQWGKSAA